MTDQLGTNVNDKKARAFQQIVTAGWGNLSDGDVNTSPLGHVSLIHIEPNELDELADAVFHDDKVDNEKAVPLYPGSYVLVEDSDGNATLTEHLTLDVALNYYNHLQALNGGEQVDRSNMPLHLTIKGAVEEAFAKIEAMTRHYYFAPDNDVTRRLCGATDGLVRMDKSNVNCTDCLRKLDSDEMMVDPSTSLPPHLRNEQCEERGCVPLRPKAISEIEEPEEKLYLVCAGEGGCGEAFDDMKIAYEHNCDPFDYAPEFAIKPESEAM